MEARVAVLEQIAADTRETLREIKDHLLRSEETNRTDFRRLEGELRRLEENQKADFRRLEETQRADFRRLEEHQRSDFRLVLSAGAAAAIGLAALMAHGFHWF